MNLNRFVGIDYSGAELPTSRLKGLQVYATADGPPQRVRTPSAPEGTRWNWSRQEVAQYLIGLAHSDTLFMAGIDHGFSFPSSYMQRHGLTTWNDFLDDFVEHWPTHQFSVEEIRARTFTSPFPVC